jgi:hypothetical protein
MRHDSCFILYTLFISLAWPSDVKPQLKTIQVNPEVITTNALPGGDGGNQWGGHQCRIVRTNNGVFTIYTSGGEDHMEREWHLMQRTDKGWKELATDKSGREPVNLMADIIGWPGYQGTMWSGKPREGRINLNGEKIIAVNSGSHPYNAAGIDSIGNICVVSSVDDNENAGRFQWAYYTASSKKWQGRISFIKHRHCYTYVFPHPDRSISLVSTRDVRWQTLGYKQPPNTFDYVFNAFRYWTAVSINHPLRELVSVEESPTLEFPFADCRAMNDVYIDSDSMMHILYTRQGKSTNGVFKRYHAIYKNNGTSVYDGELNIRKGRYCRIFQDKNHRYFILDDNGMIYLLDKEGKVPVDSVQIDLNNYPVNYAGYGLSVPRTGSKLSNMMDVVFPSHEGRYYVYFRLILDNLFSLK